MSKGMYKLLALVLTVLLATTGCSMIKVDKEMDDAEAVAEFTGGTITKGVAMKEYEAVQKMYENYGYSLTDEETVKSIKQDLLSYLVEQEIVKLKAQEQGFTEISDSEKAELEKKAEDEYNQVLEYYKTYFTGATEEETLKKTNDYLESNGYTLESAKQNSLDSVWQEKLYDYVTKDVALTDEDVTKAYDALIANDKQTYEGDPYSFEYAMVNGESVSWVPEGYRIVKHILLKFTDEQIAQLDEKQFELDEVNAEIEDRAAAASDEEEGEEEVLPEGDELIEDAETPQAAGAAPEETEAPAAEATAEPEATEAPAAEAAAEPASVPDEPEIEEPEAPDYTQMTDAELQAEKTRLEEEIEVLEADFAETLDVKITEIQGKITAGEDFDALIAEYGEDPGMQSGMGFDVGYYVSKDSKLWNEAFTAGAMAIANIGDVSDPVISSDGVHLIKYLGDAVAGALGLESVRDQVEETALEEAKSAAYDAAVAEWVAAANVKTYVDKMK